MDPEEKKEDLETAKEWIIKHNNEIQPENWAKPTYYETLKFESPDISTMDQESETSTFDETISLKIFTPKTNEQVRNRYLDKLMSMGMIKNQPSKKHQHLFIFDWDDTILCTTYLSAFQFLDISSEAKAQLVRLDKTAEKLFQKVLDRLQKDDYVYIITNAAKGWVEYSSKIYLPKTHFIIENQKVKVISARSMFGEQYPGDFGRWKIEAFKSILKPIDKYLLTNLICVGDSNIQIEAAHCLGKQFNKCALKTVKFRENPKPEELLKQLDLVIDKFKEIFASSKNLTIRLQRKVPKNNP